MDLDKHMKKYVSVPAELRANGHLLDFTIKVGQKAFRAHRLVLASHSDYFKAMFSHDSIETTNGEVVLESLDPTAVEAIIDFCYTFKIEITHENISDILIAASRLQFPAVQDICEKYAGSEINYSNCIGVAILSERCNLTELYHKAYRFCVDEFNLVIKESEYLDLDADFLKQLISEDFLNVDYEVDVIRTIINWSEVDPVNRASKVEVLLNEVRGALVDPVSLVELPATDPIHKYPACRDLVEKIKNFMLLKNHPKLQEQYLNSMNCRPRYSLKRQQRLYAVGGWIDEYKSIASGEVYDPNTDTWEEIEPMAQKRCGVGLTSLKNSIYACGGHDGTNYLNSVERYDLRLKKWFRDVADMKNTGTSKGVVTLNNYIYVIGGQIQDGATNRVERYDPTDNTWTDCTPLQTARLGMGVAVYMHYIYVMGGADKTSVFDSVERYDTLTDTWTYVSPMKAPRKHLASCTSRGKIYAVGGRNNRGPLDVAEVFDPRTNSWSYIKPMSKSRFGFGLAELAGQLFAVGGQSCDDERLSAVEAYDIDANKWVSKRPMLQIRLGGGMTVYPTRKIDSLGQQSTSLEHNLPIK